ncbi:InlB B-repeat-containing protein [Stomatobaculum longum]|uniref:InlB B-repeat-containing protein n=1 Tax=Stomatobaculum longum TaxID=796942 RepID=UPI0028E6487A|nr:InlB B-repeat-containing protein [Stomatobaculum longum]
MSNGQDIPDNFAAHVNRSISSKQILENGGQPLTKDVTIKTRHLVDRLDVVPLNTYGVFEVNKHSEINPILRFGVTKYAETMDYNVDTNGSAYVYGDPNYNPPVVEVSGAGVEITDHLEKANQRLLGFWDENDVYHDFQADGFDPDQPAYLKDGVSMYSDTKLTVMGDPNDTGAFEGQVYDLEAIFNHYGVRYAKRLVLAQEKLNDWKISGLFETRWTRLFAQQVAPGHLNYDNVIGTNGAADLPKRVTAEGRLYCEYSDYKSERVNGGPPHDANKPGGTPFGHGTAWPQTLQSAQFVLGDKAKGISVKDFDYYINPFTPVTTYYKQTDLVNPGTATEYDRSKMKVNTEGLGADQNAEDVVGRREIELTRIAVDNSDVPTNYNVTTKAQLAYRNVVYDFAGTDARLLSLTNVVSFGPLLSNRYSVPFEIEYTLSNGQTKTISDLAKYSYAPNSHGRMFVQLPDVDIANGVYVTALKVKVPSDYNWGQNTQKYGKDPAENSKRMLPEIGLGMYNVSVPKKYPGTNDKIGSVSDHESDDSYDKLTVKAKLSFEDVFGTTTSYDTTGTSERIAGQRVLVDHMGLSVSYGSTNTYQGNLLQVGLINGFTASDTTSSIVKAQALKIRPTYYYKIDKSFNYVDGSLVATAGLKNNNNPPGLNPRTVPSGVVTHFVPAGTGVGQSGSDDYGILVVSYENVPEADLASGEVQLENYNGTALYGGYYSLSFKLQAKYNADPVNVKPVMGVWLDTDFDADRDGTQGGNPQGIAVELANSRNQLVNDGPVGADFFNQGTAKISAATGKAEMLYADTTTLHKINQQAILGLLAYAQSTIPFNESSTEVSSRDIRSNDNIFSTKVYITGDNSQNTSHWELYIPVMKKGERYSYTSGGTTNQTAPNEYELDYYGIDTSTLAGLNYSVAYTTDPNPGAGGYATAKAANYSATVPANKADVTMVRVKIDNVNPSKKSFVKVQYKLHEPKSYLGNMKNQNVVFGNFNMGSSTTPYFGSTGQASLPLTYTLKDMEISGFAWDETDRNSTYNAGTDSLLQNVRFRVYDPATNTQVQLNSAPNGDFLVNSRADGSYTVLVPHDGNWIVEADTRGLAAEKKLVLQNKNGRPAIDSAFDRETNRVTTSVVVDTFRNLYSRENVNAGFYTAPKITVPNLEIPVGGGATPITAVVTDPVTPGVTFSIPSGQPTDIVTLQNSGTTTGSTTPQKTGTVTVTAETDDGYGGKVKTTATIRVYTDIEYDANNGMGTVSPNGDQLYPSTDNTGADAHTDEGTAKSVSGTGTDTGFTRPGYLFTGWNTAADGSGQSYAPGATVKTGARTAPLKLYAQWQQLTPVAEAFKIKKNVSGDWGTLPNTEVSPLLPSNFKFVMTSISANAPMPAGATSTTNPSNVTGAVDSVLFSMSSSDFSATVTSKEIATGLLTFTMPGTYSYVVQELNDGVTNYSYDSTQYKVTYTVTTGVGGTLAAQRSIENLTTSAVSGQVVFDNAYDLPTYQVTFDPQGGDVTPTTQTVKYGHYAGEPTTPAGKSSSAGDKTGYDFRGWVYEVPDPVTGAMTEVPFAFATTAVKQNYALKAKWELRKLVVVVTDAPDADGTHANEEIFRKNDVPYGTTTAEPTRPSNKTGYHFDRWLDNTNNPYDFTQPVTKNETIHATYLPNAYKVRYNANAGDATGTMTDSDHVYDVAKNLNSNAFSRPGYVFDGWNTEANGSGTNYTDAQSVMNLTTQDNAVVNLYAKWTPVTPAVANLTIQKTLTGDRGPIATGETAPLVAETFSFTLQAKSAVAGTTYPMPTGTAAGAQSQTYTIPTSDLASGSASVRTGNISFQFPGVYEYEVTESQGSATGYTYDNKVYTVRYTATQTGATIHVTTELQDGAGATFTAVTSGDATAAFTNDYQLPKYQVEFDADGGSVTPSTQTGIKRGGTPTEPTAASPSTSPAGDKTGHHFVGWFEEDPSGNISSTPYDFTAPLTGNKKLKAKWAVNEYKVKVKDAPTADGTHANEVIHSDDHVPYNGQIPSQTAPNNKTGYHFNGWVDESDNSPYTFGTPVQRDTTVVATYAPNNYKVHYEPNGTNVSGTVTDSNHVYDVAKNLNQNNFTRPGYTFGGWNTQANGGGQSYTDQQSVTNLTTTDNGTVTLYAIWTPVGGATEAFSVKKTLTGDVGLLANGETAPLTAENFRFELKAISTTAFGLSGALPMPAAAAGQQTYVMQVGTAGLTLIRGVTDTQAGESNGTVTSGPFSFTMPGEYVYEVKELGNGVTGYTYDSKVYTLKYKVQQVGTILTVTKEVSENGGSFTAFTGALDFTNDYQRPQYTVTYDADGGNVTPSTETVKHGNKATEPQTQTGHTSPAGEKTGYHFGGWIDTATNAPYNFNTPVTGNKNLKAKWDINQYRVIVKEPHDADPGMQDHEYLNNPNVNHGDTVTAPQTPNNKTGHHFNGWVDQGGNPYTFGTPVTGDTTVTATYAPNNYTVQYDKNASDATGTVPDSTHVYDVARNLNNNTYTRPGYEFAGWATTPTGTVTYPDQQSVINLTNQNNGVVKLYAVWTQATPATEAFGIRKTLSGDVGQLPNGETAPIVADTFTFRLTAKQTNAPGLTALPMPLGTVAGAQTADFTISSAGLSYGSFGTAATGTAASGLITFTLPGDYYYEVTELAGSAAGYTYGGASKVYTLHYKVTQSGTTLSVTKEVKEGSGAYAPLTGVLAFDNSYALPSYTVTFNAQGGDVTPVTQTVKYGHFATRPQTQAGKSSPAGDLAGHTFQHWNKQGDPATTAYDFEHTPVTGNITLNANWSTNSYTITVTDSPDANPPHQNEVISNTTVSYNTPSTEPNRPNNRTGYHFDHWEKNNDPSHTPYTFGTPVTGNETIHAVYAPNRYTVRYNKDAADASGTVADSSHTYDVPQNLNNNAFTRPGYEFAGWSRTQGSTTMDFANQASVVNLSDTDGAVVDLYAVWTAATPVTANVTIQKTLTGDITTTPGGLASPVTPETFRFELKAISTTAPGITALPMPAAAAGAQTAVLTLNTNDLTAGSGSVQTGNITFTMPGEYIYELKELPSTAAGFTFDQTIYGLKYTVTQNGTTLSVAAQSKTGSNAYQNFAGTASFTNDYQLPKFRVTYDSDLGSATPPTESNIKYGHFATQPGNAVGTSSPAGDRTGYHFQHWIDIQTGQIFNFGDPITRDVNLKAVWARNTYTVTVNDGPDATTPNQNISTQTVTHGDPSTEPNRPNNKPGYHFGGWQTGSNTPYTFGTPVTENQTIHATYTPNHYTVRYEANGSNVSGTVADSQHTYDVAAPLTQNSYTRPGYQFGGWATRPDGTGTQYTDRQSVMNLTQVDGDTVSLYAIWTPVTPYQLDLGVQKLLTGEVGLSLATGETSPLNTEAFRFKLSAVSTTAAGGSALPMPNGTVGAQETEISINGAGTGTFGPIDFVYEGDYIYRLTEVPGAATGYTYDPAVYEITVRVSQSGITMNGTASVKKNGGTATAVAGNLAFSNDYQLPRFNVSFNPDGGSSTPNTQTVRYGDPVVTPGNAPGTNSPAGDKTGYHFKHWAKPDGTPYHFGDPVTSDTPLIAIWEINRYTITVTDAPDANPGHQNRIITTDNQVPHGTVPTEPTHPDNKTDYVFDHWEKPDGTPYRFDEPMTGNITVHAVYRQKQYNVTFEQNGSNVIGNMPNQHFNGGETKPLTGNTYARPGYVFSGWGRTPVAATPDFADGQTVSNLTGTDGDTVHLYAIWTPVTPAVVSVPTVIKQITGDTPHNAGQFSFTLTAVSSTASGSQMGIPMPAAAQGDTDRITVNGAGQGNFGDITFRLPGTYVYRIAELPEGRKGFSFDPDEVTLTYIVTQNGLNLNVTTSAQKNGNPVTDATFVNRFTVPDYTITFDGNGSWIRIPTQSVREGNHGTDPQTTMLRTESKFIGWYLNGQPYDFNTPVYDDITLVAMYEYKPSEDNSGGSGSDGGGGNGGGGNSSHRGGKTTPNTNPLNPGISDTTVVPPVSPTEPSPDLPAEEKRTPQGEAISPTERHKTTVVTGTSKRSKRGKLPKTGEAPISNPLPHLATLTLAAYALLAEEKRRREQTK